MKGISVGCGTRTFVAALVLMIAALLLVGPVFAQTSTGRILGSVRDQTGGVISGATITVTDVARGINRTLTTDQAGAFLAPNLAPSTYTVRAEYAGFQAFERQNAVVGVGQDVALDIVMSPGAQTQTITVTEEIPLVNTTSATLGGALNNQAITDLPLNGRNFTQLLELRPGVILNLGNDSGGAGSASANGLRSEQSNEYLVEGLHGMSPFNGQPVMNSLALRGDASSILPPDSIQEFNQQFNAKAEYGYRAGGTINIGLKSGTNTLHGSAYGFFRRHDFDARNYFNTPPQPQLNTSLNQYGGTLGGAIIQDKLFFFAGFEQQRLDVGDQAVVQTPFTDVGMLNCAGAGAGFNCTPIAGSISGGGTPDVTNHLVLACIGMRQSVGAANLSPQSLLLAGLDQNCNPLSSYPNAANGSTWFVEHGGSDHGAGTPGNRATVYFPNLQTVARNLGSIAKVDYVLSEKHTVNGFAFIGNSDATYSSARTQPLFRTGVPGRPILVAGTWSWIPDPAWVNAFRVGYAQERVRYNGLDVATGLCASDFGLPTGADCTLAPNHGYPQALTINGFTAIGSRNTEIQGPERSIEFNDQISYLRGDHNLKFGGNLMINEQNGGSWGNTRGVFTFGRSGSGDAVSSGLAAFFVGNRLVPDCTNGGVLGVGGCSAGTQIRSANSGLENATLFYGDPESHIRQNVYSLFVQDDWRFNQRLTLNFGLRYDIASVIHDRDHILATFDPVLGLVQEGVHVPQVYNPDHNNFQPRIGFAWDMFGTGKTSLRGGFGISHELVILRTYSEVGNDIGLAGNATAFTIGCTGTYGSSLLAPGAQSNCNGLLVTPGGTRNAGSVEWTRGDSTVGAVNWDAQFNGGTTIFPSGSIRTCDPNLFVRDSPLNDNGRQGTPCAVVSSDPHLRTPYIETWTLAMQHAFTTNLSLEVAYVGNHGVKLISHTDDNQTDPGLHLWNTGSPTTFAQDCEAQRTSEACDGSSLSDLVFDSRPFANQFGYLSSITKLGNLQTSNYNGLQLSLMARNFHGLSLVSGYTFAHANSVSDSNGADVVSNSYNVGLDYGRAATDVRHRLTLSPTYNIPGMDGYGGLLQGWRLAGAFKYQSGRPWNPDAAGDFSGTGYNSRWDFAGDPGDFKVDYRGIDVPTFHSGLDAVATCGSAARSEATLEALGCWTQGSSFITPPPVDSFGNMPRNLFGGPTFWNLDFSLTKVQRFTERLSTEFRVETFNIFNHPAFAGPETDMGQDNFGQTGSTPDVAATNPVVGTGGQRRIQFGVKILF